MAPNRKDPVALLRSARFPAIILLAAAVAALIVANSPLGAGAETIKETYLGIPGVFEMSVGHWIQDGLLAIFFFVVAIELQFELTAGEHRLLALHPGRRRRRRGAGRTLVGDGQGRVRHPPRQASGRRLIPLPFDFP